MKENEFFEIEMLRLMQNVSKIITKVEDEFLKKFHLTHFHARYIANLFRYKRLKMKDLNNLLCVDKANTTRAVRDLINKGFVEKVGVGERKFDLQLSENGEKVAKEFKRKIDSHLDESFKKFTTEEKKTLFRLMNKLSEGVADAGNI
ncbi:MAG TPA: MarR family transcriptional regulator [Candidatus Onthoplasma faecipullorum]|nr:MarR family transcriptional regulator [Candidatus Onthoplasma faecipullorum]